MPNGKQSQVYSWEEVSWITGFSISDLLALFAGISATEEKQGTSMQGISQENLDELTSTEKEMCVTDARGRVRSLPSHAAANSMRLRKFA